jgi:hypothetical protein
MGILDQRGSDRSDMSPVATRVAEAVCRNSSRVLCFACLAAQEGLDEHDVRAAALVLISRAGLILVRRVCYTCQRMDEMLVSRRAG